MKQAAFPYTNVFKDARGVWRCIIRAPNQTKKTTLAKADTKAGVLVSMRSPEFGASYYSALNGVLPSTTGTIGKTSSHGSLAWAINDYFQNDLNFAKTTTGTQYDYRRAVKGIIEKDGHRMVHDMPENMAIVMIEEIARKSASTANLAKTVLKQTFKRAIRIHRLRTANPFSEMDNFETGTWHTWTETEISQFENRWPIGTFERLVQSLLLYTGQRMGDVYGLRRRHIEQVVCEACEGTSHNNGNPCSECSAWGATGTIPVWHLLEQEKTGTEMWVPLHPDLVAVMELSPIGPDYILSNKDGQQIGRRTLNERIGQAIANAKLCREGKNRCVPHGLRKSCATRLANRGASVHMIQAITGHKSMKEISRYTAKANQRSLSVGSMKMLGSPSQRKAPPMLEHHGAAQ